jgi:hypothetical protein
MPRFAPLSPGLRARRAMRGMTAAAGLFSSDRAAALRRRNASLSLCGADGVRPCIGSVLNQRGPEFPCIFSMSSVRGPTL